LKTKKIRFGETGKTVVSDERVARNGDFSNETRAPRGRGSRARRLDLVRGGGNARGGMCPADIIAPGENIL